VYTYGYGREVREGEWVQVTNYKMCVTRCCWGGSSAPFAVESWLVDCGGGVGWKISSSYWFEESRCVELVGLLIWDFCVNL